MDYFDETADKMARLAMHPGWIDWVRDHVKKLQSDEYEGIYENLGHAVAQRIEALKSGKNQSNPVEPPASASSPAESMGDHQSPDNGREQANPGDQAGNQNSSAKQAFMEYVERHKRAGGMARTKANR